MAVVVFDPDAFRIRYPEFDSLTDAQLQAAFDDTALYLDNTDCSIVAAPSPRTQLLNLLTAHIAALSYGVNGENPTGFVGAVNSVTEGSVTISADVSGYGAGSAWFLQTPYGAAYWQATLQYRKGFYVPVWRPTYGRY
jgi:Protein of unknown function (DUF4054)